MIFRACLVAAVSSATQATEDKYSIPQQIASGQAHCAMRNWPVVATVIIPGHSRAYAWLDELVSDCPEYAELVRLIRSETVDILVVRDYDRLWRTDALRAQVTALCKEHKVQIFSLNQPIEPLPRDKLEGGSDSHLIIEALSGVISQMENETRKRRMKIGLEARVLKGLHATAAATPYGYRFVATDQPLEPDPDTAPIARWILEQRAMGLGYVAIAQTLERMGISPPRAARWRSVSIMQIVHNPFYAGIIAWGTLQNEHGLHTPLIDQATWERVQAVNTLRANRRYTTNRLFSGLCRCAYCGNSMVYQHEKGKSRLRLACCLYTRTGGKECRSNQLPEHRLRAYVLDALQTVFADPAAHLARRNADNHRAERQGQLVALDAELERIERAWARWDGLFERGGITEEELLGHRARLLAQRAKLQQQRQTLRDTLARAEAAEANVLELAPLRDYLCDMPDSELRPILQRLIQTIVIERKRPPLIQWW